MSILCAFGGVQFVVRSLPFRAESVDLIVEKGAMDVFETDRGEDPWHSNPLCTKRMHAWLSEAHRVLSPSGLLVSVSFAQPHFRSVASSASLCTLFLTPRTRLTPLGSSLILSHPS